MKVFSWRRWFICVQILSQGLLPVFPQLMSNVKAEDKLTECIDATDVPQRVNMVYIQLLDASHPLSVTDQDAFTSASVGLFNQEQSLRNDTFLTVEWASKTLSSQSSNGQNSDSAKMVLQTTLQALQDSAVREDNNLIAIAGGGLTGDSSEVLNLASQLYGYPHLGDAYASAMSNRARFPMFVRLTVSDSVSSQMYIEFLVKMHVCKIIVLVSDEYMNDAHAFVQDAKQAGIAVINRILITEETTKTASQEAIDAVLEHDVHFVVLFLNPLVLPPILAHVHLAQVQEKGHDIVWMGSAVHTVHMFYDYLVQQEFHKSYEVFAENNLTIDDAMDELQGSFGHHQPLPTGPVAAHFYAKAQEDGPWQVAGLPVMAQQWIADMFLAAAHGVRAMNADGLGCYLHSQNFNERVAMTLYQYIIAQKFWGNSGWVEFDSNGERVSSLVLVNYHRGHPVEHGDPLYNPQIVEPMATSSIVGNFNSGELVFDPNKTIIWPGGSSPEDPGTNPSAGHDTHMGHNSSICHADVEIITTKHVDKLSMWIVIVVCVMGALVLLVVCRLYCLKMNLENKIKDMEAPHLVGSSAIDLEAPVGKMLKVLDDFSKGTSPKIDEVRNLKSMIEAGSVMAPNLVQQLKSRNQDFYSNDAIQFVLNNALPKSMQPSSPPATNEKSPNRKMSFMPNFDSKQSFPMSAATFTTYNSQYLVSDLHCSQMTLIGESSPDWDFFGKPVISSLHDRFSELKSKIGFSLCLETIELHQFTNRRPLQLVAMHVLDKSFNLVSKLRLNEEKLINFLKVIEDGYHASNPYHNSTHAADVTARFAALMYQSHLDDTLLDNELLAGIIAAIVHDYQHPGSSNSFQIQAKTAASSIYNEIHVLENASLFLALELLSQPDTAFVENMSKRQLSNTKKLIIQSVLATDLSEHFNIYSEFKSKIPPGTFQKNQVVAPEQRDLILNMALKCADVGHVTVGLQEHIRWVQSLQSEFYLQGDCERKLGFPISMLMDRNKARNGPAHGEQQLGFFDFICIPMYEAWVERFPSCSVLTENLAENRRHWEVDAQLANSQDVQFSANSMSNPGSESLAIQVVE